MTLINMKEAAEALGLSKQRFSTAWHTGKELNRPMPIMKKVNVYFYERTELLAWYARFKARPLESPGMKKLPKSTLDNTMAHNFLTTKKTLAHKDRRHGTTTTVHCLESDAYKPRNEPMTKQGGNYTIYLDRSF